MGTGSHGSFPGESLPIPVHICETDNMFKLYKMFSTEGGCRVPLVVKQPAANIAESSGRGESIVTDAYCTVMDLVPTLLDLAGLEHLGTRYKGRQIAPLRGKSWRDFLAAASSSARNGRSTLAIHSPDYVTGFECAGSGALRRGDWKITYVPAPRGPQRWELFNMKEDPGETNDLRNQQPSIFSELLVLWEDYKKEVGVVGLAGEYQSAVQGDPRTSIRDEFEDPYSWIKYIGRPEITPAALKHVIPS